MAINKVIYDGRTLIDLSGDSVKADKLLRGYKAHGADGKTVTGTCDYDVNSRDATAAEADTLSGKTFYAGGSARMGIMKNNGAVTGTISVKEGQYTVPQGYHNGNGKVGIAAQEIAKLVPANIREGISILGIDGAMTGTEDIAPQKKTVVPSSEKQAVLPDGEYNCLSEVTVEAIPYSRSDNAAGGITVTIG